MDEQAKQVERSRSELSKSLESIKVTIISCEKQLDSIKKSIVSATGLYNVKLKEHQQLLFDLKTVENKIIDAKKELEAINTDIDVAKSSLQDINDLIEKAKVELQTANYQIDEAVKRKSDLSREIVNKEVEFETQKQERESTISILDSKIVDLATSLDQRRQEELTTRGDLAIWEKALEERDLNLRIREEKVNQSESKIIRNSNLMNI